ncbi:hypothetical protein [Nostoc sp.]
MLQDRGLISPNCDRYARRRSYPEQFAQRLVEKGIAYLQLFSGK